METDHINTEYNIFFSIKNYSLITNSSRSFGNHFISIADVSNPSKEPNAESIPKVTSIRKKSKAKKVDAGSRSIASVNATKARPDPPEVYE